MSVGRVTFLDSLISHVILLYKCLRRGAGLEGGGDKGTGGGGQGREKGEKLGGREKFENFSMCCSKNGGGRQLRGLNRGRMKGRGLLSFPTFFYSYSYHLQV